MIYCWINFGLLTAMVGGLIYATTPLIVLSGRMIQAENAIIPCLLACMVGISLYFKTKKDYWLLATAVVAGIATLFKLTGMVCHLFVFLALLKNSNKNIKTFWKDFGFFLAISLPISFLYVVYGAVYGLENFKNILFSNYNRFYGIGPNSLIELIRNQRLTQHKFLPEVSIISGWIIFLGLITKKHKNIGTVLVIWSILAYLIIYIFFGSQPYGWYAFPFWPMLIMMLAIFLTDGLKKGKNLIVIFFLLMMILGDNISRLVGIFDFQPYADYWRFGVSGIFIVLIVLTILKFKNKLPVKILLLLLLIAIICTNLIYLNRINIDFWWQNIS
jgi:4-amino-4-deoxy-L-arabinose transferase-like glycosyltransferase